MNDLLSTAIAAGLLYGQAWANHTLGYGVTTEQVDAAEQRADDAWAAVKAARKAEMGVSSSDTEDVECPACDNGKVKDWQHEDDGARQWAVEIELTCEVCNGHALVSRSVWRDYTNAVGA